MWLPISLAFAVAITIGGFGPRAILSSPGAVLFAAVFVVLSLVPGAIVSFFAVAATRVADRVMKGRLPQRKTRSVALIHGALAGFVAGLLTWLWLLLNEQSTDTTSSTLTMVFIVSAVAATSTARGLTVKQSKL